MKDDRSTAIRRAIAAAAAALLGWLLYAVIQRGTSNQFIGIFVDILYILCRYLLMPFAFSGLLAAMIGYVLNRIRGGCGRDIAVAALMLAAFALAFFVTGPVTGEAGTLILTAVFLAVRLAGQLFFR